MRVFRGDAQFFAFQQNKWTSISTLEQVKILYKISACGLNSSMGFETNNWCSLSNSIILCLKLKV
jgi:hypothetical protein